MSGYSSIHPRCLSYVAFEICANVECCHDFMAKMDVGTALVQMKYWCGFMAKTSIGMTSVLIWNVDVTSWLHECWHDFCANEVLTWLHECWHGFGTNEVLSWLHGKDGCWDDFNANELLTWLHGKDEVLTWFCGKKEYWHDFITNVECCHGFMAKMNCWRSFMASMRMKCWTLAPLRCKWNVVVTSWQKWMLA